MAYRWNGIECDTIEELRQLRNQNISMPQQHVKSSSQELSDRHTAEMLSVVPRGHGHHSECACGHCPTEERPSIGEPGGPCCGKGGDCNCDRL